MHTLDPTRPEQRPLRRLEPMIARALRARGFPMIGFAGFAGLDGELLDCAFALLTAARPEPCDA